MKQAIPFLPKFIDSEECRKMANKICEALFKCRMPLVEGEDGCEGCPYEKDRLDAIKENAGLWICPIWNDIPKVISCQQRMLNVYEEYIKTLSK